MTFEEYTPWSFEGVSGAGAFGGTIERNCPVEGFGWVERNGVMWSWYFRARWCDWNVNVGRESQLTAEFVDGEGTIWRACGKWGAIPAAGWMPYSIAEKIVRAALTRFLANEDNWRAPDDIFLEREGR